MPRIVDFPEDVARREAPTERFKLKRRHQSAQRRRWWFKVKIGIRLSLLLGLIGLFMAFPTLPIWRYQPDKTVITGANDDLTLDQIRTFLAKYAGQSLLTLNPQTLATQFKSRFPLAYGVWFRRSVGGGLSAHVEAQKPWALLLPQADGQAWGVLTDRYQVLPMNQLPASLVDRLNRETATNTSNTAASTETLTKQAASSSTDLPVNTTTTEGVAEKPERLPQVLSPAEANWMRQPQLRERVALVLQQLTAMPKIQLQYLDLTDPIDAVARFDRFNVRLGQLDKSLTRKRLPRLVHLIDPVLSGKHGDIDRIDLRWEGELTFHRRRQTTP